MTLAVIIDSNILIAIERQQLKAADVFAADFEPILPAIVYAEVLTGIEKDSNLKRAKINRQLLEDFKNICNFSDFGEAEARALAQLRGEMNSIGQKRGKYDLMIAATARTHNAEILSHDRAVRFADIPGIRVREI